MRYNRSVGEIVIGTSGYSYDDWVGPIYPSGTRQADFLPLYARRFAFTELNFSYYRLPEASTLRSIALKTPPRFRFSVKAHRSLTHDRAAGWAREAGRFAEAAAALAAVPRPTGPAGPDGEPAPGSADQLAGVLLQFPFSFHYTAENRRYLASLADALAPLRLFVEFRNAEWDLSSVWTEMERRGLGLVVPDLPRLEGLPTTPPRLTAPWGYVRFHGRNAANWWNGTNVTRYDYSYREEELAAWIGPIEALEAQSETLLIAFNNHDAGQAVRNAEMLAAMLAARP